MRNRRSAKFQCPTRGPATTVGLALLLVLSVALLWAPSAHAQGGTQCAASMTIIPSISPPTPLTEGPPNNVVTFQVLISQTCTTNGAPAPAVVKGTTRVDVACATANNLGDPSGTGCAAVEQLNTLHVTSCAGNQTGVSCNSVTDVNGQPTIVAITYSNTCTPILGSGSDCLTLPFGTSVKVATITAQTQAGQEVLTPPNQFFVTGSTGGSNVDSGAAQASAQGSGPEVYPPPPPTMSLTKSCVATFNPDTQQVNVSFTSTLTNTGSFEQINISACSDVPAATLNGVPASLTTGQSATITGSYTQSSLNASDTLTCNGIGVSTQQAVSANNSALCSAQTSPKLALTKACTAVLNAQGSATVSFTATLTNTGNENLNQITCADSPVVTLTGVPSSLAVGASAVITGSYSSTTPSPFSDTLSCSGKGVVSGTTVPIQQTASCSVTCSPSISVTKTCTNPPAGSAVIAFSGTVTNTGDVTISNITCSDSANGISTPVQPGSGSLAPGVSTTYSDQYSGTPGSNQDTVTCTGVAPTVCGGGSVQTPPASATCLVQTLSTTPSPRTGIVGSVLTDTATLVGVGPGTVTFKLFDNQACSGSPVFGPDSHHVDGPGQVTSNSFTATVPGTFEWVVVFTPDNTEQTPLVGNCGDEPVTITGPAIPTLSEWGMLLLVGLLVGGGLLTLRRRKNLTTA
jgi:exosortase sorting signal-containing protein